MPLRTSDGQRRLVRFQSLSEYPIEVEEFDPELSEAHVDGRRRFTHPDPDDTQQLLDAWFAGLRRRVPYLQWADQLHGLVEHWSRQGCTLSDDYVRELEQWIRQCQSLAAQRERLLALENARRSDSSQQIESTRRVGLHAAKPDTGPAANGQEPSSPSTPSANDSTSIAAPSASQKQGWWSWLGNELYWLGQMLIGRREGPDGKPQSYPWSPFREWANDAEKIPFNPVPADAIAGAMEGDLLPAVKEGALRAVTGGLSKYSKGPKTVLRFADEPVTFTRKMLSQSKVIHSGRQIKKVDTLVKEFGGTAKGWVKKKGWDETGKEWHWYEHHGIGRVGVKPASSPDPF